MIPPFLTYREKDGDILGYFILQKAFPHFCGKLVGYPVEGAIINTPIAGYNFYVTFNGTIRGNMIPNYRDVEDEIKNVFEAMALWYLHNIIEKNEKLYSKFKIKSNDSVSQR